ncbi:MAG: penicillin-binding protein, partial [Sulfurovum sp.]
KGIELAGKTGTTNSSIDAWFCGYSPTIEVISWFGRDDNKPIGRKGATGGGLAAPAFAYYYEKLLELYPETKRTFDIPEGVFRGEYEGKSELYTTNSPLPSIQKPQNEYESMLEEETEIIEDIDPEDEEIGLAETLNIDEDPEEEEVQEEDDPLHPKRNVPKTPVSEDSGTLF